MNLKTWHLAVACIAILAVAFGMALADDGNESDGHETVTVQLGSNVYITIDKVTRTGVVSGSGNMYEPASNTNFYDNGLDDYARYLTSVTFAEESSVQTVGYGAFSGCKYPKSIELPSTIHTISDGAFGSCTSLTSITIPGSVVYIGNQAFRNTGLTSVTIPASVISVGQFAFCQSCLKEVVFEGTPILYQYAFHDQNSDACVLYYMNGDPIIYPYTTIYGSALYNCRYSVVRA